MDKHMIWTVYVSHYTVIYTSLLVTGLPDYPNKLADFFLTMLFYNFSFLYFSTAVMTCLA